MLAEPPTCRISTKPLKPVRHIIPQSGKKNRSKAQTIRGPSKSFFSQKTFLVQGMYAVCNVNITVGGVFIKYFPFPLLRVLSANNSVIIINTTDTI